MSGSSVRFAGLKFAVDTVATGAHAVVLIAVSLLNAMGFVTFSPTNAMGVIAFGPGRRRKVVSIWRYE